MVNNLPQNQASTKANSDNYLYSDRISLETASIVEVSIVMPCLNEAETLKVCISKAQQFLDQHHIHGEIIIADNGSTDNSHQIAEQLGAKVIYISKKGYGHALRGGIFAAKGKYIIMGDADDSYDFHNLSPFLEKLQSGYDLVMGNRFKGGIKPGAMPFLHKYLGNPILTGIGRVFFASTCGDFHCGLRGFRKAAIETLNLRTTGMEFASEMVVKATLYKMKIAEVPTTLSPDGRSRRPHLRSWRDGWRHLRFLLLYSPRWLFLYPGILLILIGLCSSLFLLSSPRVNSLLYSSAAIIIGFQTAFFALFTKAFAISEGLLPEDSRLKKMSWYFNLETGLILGLILLLLGLLGSISAFSSWKSNFFGALDPMIAMKVIIPSVTFLALGFQVIFSSFFLSVLGLKRR